MCLFMDVYVRALYTVCVVNRHMCPSICVYVSTYVLCVSCVGSSVRVYMRAV